MLTIIEYIASVGVVISYLLISCKNKFGFVVGLFAQTLWIVFGIIEKQWGFTIMCIFLTATCVWGIVNWFKK